MKDEEIDIALSKAASAAGDPNPETLRRVADSIAASLGRVRPLPPTWILTAGLVLACAAVSLAGAAQSGFGGIDAMNLVERVLVFSTLLALAAAAGVGFVHQMIPGSRQRFSPRALLAMVSLLLVAVFALLFHDLRTTHFFSAGIACLLTGLLFALPAGIFIRLLLLRGFAVSPASAGLIAGALAGLAGLGMLELHCNNFQAAHVLVWHTAVVPSSAALGACVAWVLRRRHA